jgi:hypothetical protein
MRSNPPQRRGWGETHLVTGMRRMPVIRHYLFSHVLVQITQTFDDWPRSPASPEGL